MRTTPFVLGTHTFRELRSGREGQLVIRTARRAFASLAQGGESLRMRRTWYADPPPEGGTQTPAPTPPPSPAPTPPPDADKGEPEIGTPEWVKKDPEGAYKEIQKLRDKEAKDRIDSREFNRIKAELEKYETQQKEASENKLREDGKLDELVKKAQTERDEALKKAQEAELKATRVTIAAEFKLTPTQAKRLQGSTEEELRKDAEDMVKEFGLDKQQAGNQQPLPPDPKKQTQTTVAPGGRTVAETDQEKRDRLYKRGSQNTPLFNKPES